MDFSIVVNDSTSVSYAQSLIVYVRTLNGGNACVYFIGLVSVENATAKSLHKILISFCHGLALIDEFMRQHFIGFCSDGARAMTGEHNGLARQLMDGYPLIK